MTESRKPPTGNVVADDAYVSGQVVNVTIQGALVEGLSVGLDLSIRHPETDGELRIAVPIGWSNVRIEPAAPSDWPPRPGDLWRDRDGDLWLCRTWTAKGAARSALVCSRPDVVGKAGMFGGGLAAEKLLARFSPLQLVHCESGGAR